jgi:ABC-2 type transport system permease protein
MEKRSESLYWSWNVRYRLLHYYSVFYQNCLNATAKLLSFRVNFILSFIVEFSSAVIAYTTIAFIFNHINQLGSWDRDHFMLFASWMQSILCLHTTIGAPNFWNFSDELQNGKLDFRLLRPIGSLFDAFTAIIRPSSAVVFPLHLAIFAYFACQVGLSWVSWIIALPLLILAFLILLLTELVVALFMFWTIQGDGINFLRMQGQQLQKWPDFIYPTPIRSIFTFFFPLLIPGSFSIMFLLNPGEIKYLIIMLFIFVILILLVSYQWKLGLRRYESASS